jgi:hypothetical protein
MELLPEVDFKVRSFKQPLVKSMNSVDGYHQLSQTYYQSHSNGINSMNNIISTASLPLTQPIKLIKNKSISMPK